MRLRTKGVVCALACAMGGGVAPSAWAGEAREQMAFADEALSQMDRSASTMRSSLAAARSQRDVVKTNCINDKLNQLEITLRKARDERGTLRRASLREDQDGIAHSFQILRVLDQRAKQLQAEANQCVGEELAYAGQTKVTAEVYAVQQSYGDSGGDFETAGGWGGAPPARRLAEEKDKLDADMRAPSTPAAPPPKPPAAAPAAPFAPTPAPAGSPYAADATHEASMLAYTADLALAVFEVDKGLASVESIASDVGGYLSQRSDQQVTVRVPRPRFGEAMRRIEKLGDVTHRNVSAEDVGDEYVDLELRLKNARETRDRLAELLKLATVKDAVEIEKELAKVTEVIEQIEGRLKLLRDRVGFSTITVSFQTNAPSQVRSTAILPFAWLDTMGLAPLLNVPKVYR